MKYLFLLAVILSLSACCNDEDCIDRESGHYKLIDSLDHWIPFEGGESIVFKNSNGFVGDFSSSALEEKEIRIIIDENYQKCSDAVCYDYYTLDEKILNFTSSEANITISYCLRKNVNYDVGRTGLYNLNWDRLSDILVLSINNHSLPIPIASANETEFEANTVILDSLVLDSTVYYNVIHSYISEDMEASILKGIYYTHNDGIIGFYLTNEELWTRD